MILSIIIAYYNAEDYIVNLLDSLMDQGFQEDEYEIIVVDDESTHCVQRLKDYCESHSNVHYVWQKNARQSIARNNGIARANGEFLYVCDNDDIVNRQVLKQICNIAHDNSLDILFFNRLLIPEGAEAPPAQRDFSSLEPIQTGQQYIANHPKTSTGPWHYIIRREFVNKNHLKFPEGIIICEDVDFMIDACVKAQRVSYINVDVYYWVQHPQSISHYAGMVSMTERFLNDMLWYVEKRKMMLNRPNDLLPSFAKWIDLNINRHAYRILSTSLKYLGYKKNLEMVKRLKRLGLYPVSKTEYEESPKVHFFKSLMNMKPIWVVCCRLYTLVPQKIRIKYL